MIENLCPKTDGMDCYCPWCAVSQSLYKGNKEDKKLARTYSRREKYVGNVFIVNDPRDENVDDEYKVSGKVLLYEFPATVEATIKNEMTDKQEGFGMSIFDPEDGNDMLIKIRSKKPDKNGKTWPDYSDTMFARKPTSLGTETEIDELMEDTVELEKYLKDTQLDWSTHEKLLKVEGLWEEVKDEFNRRVNKEDNSKDTSKEDNSKEDTSKEDTSKEDTSKDTGKEDISKEDIDDIDDIDELLNKLKNM